MTVTNATLAALEAEVARLAYELEEAEERLTRGRLDACPVKPGAAVLALCEFGGPKYRGYVPARVVDIAYDGVDTYRYQVVFEHALGARWVGQNVRPA